MYLCICTHIKETLFWQFSELNEVIGGCVCEVITGAEVGSQRG